MSVPFRLAYTYTAAEFQFFQDSEPPDAMHSTREAYLRSNAVWSVDSYVASLASLHRLRPQRAFFSHDPVVWARGLTGC